MQRLVTGLSAHSQPTAGPIRARCDSAAAALAHEPRGVRTPRESAPCPRELALRARERDTSALRHLPTPAVCSAVRVSLSERDEDKGDSFVWTLADSAHRNHAHNAIHPGTADKRASESHTSRATDVLSRPLFIVPSKNVQVDDGTRTDDGIEFVDELFDQDGRVRFPGRRPGSIPRPTPPQLSLDRPDPYPPLAPQLPDRARAPGAFDHRTALKLVAVDRQLRQRAVGARLVRDEQHGQVGRAPLEPPSESQQLAHLGAKLTIDESRLVWSFATGVRAI